MRMLLAAILAVSATAGVATGQASSAGTFPATICNPAPASPADLSLICPDFSIFDEPAAPLETGSVQSLRLLYARSFDPKVVVRIDTSADGEMTLTVKELTIPLSETDRTPIHLDLNTTVRLGHAERTNMLAVLGKNDFWNAPAQYHLDWNLGPFGSAAPKKDAVVMNDGAIWVIEGMTVDRYHVMLDDGGAFPSPVREIGLAMLLLAKKKIPALDLYPIY